MKDCVATAPMPASAQGTDEPTLNQCDCTATPICPVSGSRATIEKVCTGLSGRLNDDDVSLGSWAFADELKVVMIRVAIEKRIFIFIDFPLTSLRQFRVRL